MNVFEAIRKATDPFGMDGERTAAVRPDATEVLNRLGKQGFVVVPRSMVRYEFIAENNDAPAGAGDEVEAYRG